jgi:glycosyltransferase 2 family protein
MKARMLFWLRVGVSVALLGYLLSLIDLDSVLERLAEVDVRYLAVAFVLLLLQTCLSALKWQVILRADGVLMRLPFLIKTYFIGNFISLFLPTSFGGDIYRVVAARGVNQDLAKSTSSVVFDRLSGLFALVSICMIAYIVLPDQPYGLVVLILYVLGVAGFLVVSSNAVGRRIEASGSGLLRRAGKILMSFRNYRRNAGVMAMILLLSFLFQLNLVLINKVYTMAVGLQIDLLILLVIIPLIYLTEVLPISINGLGVRESAFAFFFVQIGLTVGDALAVSVLIVGMRYLVGLLGGSLLLATVISSRTTRPVVSPSNGAPAPKP